MFVKLMTVTWVLQAVRVTPVYILNQVTGLKGTLELQVKHVTLK